MDNKEIKIIKLMYDCKKGIASFFRSNIDTRTPVVTIVTTTNVTDKIKELLSEENKGLFSDARVLLQLEAAARIYKVENGELKSAFLNKKCLGSILSDAELIIINEHVAKDVVDINPYSSEGITYSFGEEKLFPITFMKHQASSNYSLSMIEKAVEGIIEEYKDSKERELLEFIYNNKMFMFKSPRKVNKFGKHMYVLNFLLNNKLEGYKLFYYIWQHPWFLDIKITGIVAGMSKLLIASDGLPHNAVDSFITMYNAAMH